MLAWYNLYIYFKKEKDTKKERLTELVLKTLA
jgi:hypothetical protein